MLSMFSYLEFGFNAFLEVELRLFHRNERLSYLFILHVYYHTRGKHLHENIISHMCEVWADNTSLIPSLCLCVTYS